MRRIAARSIVLALVAGVAGAVAPATASAATADLVVTKTTWDPEVNPGDWVGYVIEVTNTTAAPVTVDTVTDDLPDGFTYQSGMSSGLSEDDPTIADGVLTWEVDEVIGADSSQMLSFYAEAPEEYGTFLNSASATAAGATVQGSGPTAAVEVAPYDMEFEAEPENEAVSLWWWSYHSAADHARLFYRAGGTPPALGEGTEVTIPEGETYVTVDGLTNGSPYSFSVFIFDVDGNLVDQSSTTATPAPQPMELHTHGGDQQVDLAWSSDDPSVTHYRLFYRVGETPPELGEGTEVTLPEDHDGEATVTGLTNGTKYAFTIFALDETDAVVEKASATATPQLGPPQHLQATSAGPNAVRLSWINSPSADETIIRYSSESTPYQPTEGTGVPVPAGAETVEITGLTTGTEYYFSAFSKDGDQVSWPTYTFLAPFDCPDLSAALDAPAGLVVDTSWVACAGAQANSNSSTLDTALPRTGTQALMTSGDVGIALPPSDGDDEGEDLMTGARGAHDVSIFRIDLDVPAGTSCLSFDYAFASDEYPEYVGEEYNDGFVAELDQNDWSVDGNVITAPHNFARTSDGSYASVNSPIFANEDNVLSPTESNTGYDGFSQPLRASTPITPGAHSLYLSIFDAGDSSLDSAAFIDRLRVSSEECTAGTSIPPTAVDDTAETAYQTPVTTNVLANDTDPLGEALAVTDNTEGSDGSVTCTPSACTYTPDNGFSGEDTYTYTVSNASGGTDVGKVTVTVADPPPNQTPVANDDVATTPSNTSKVINVLANDSDGDGHTLAVTAKTNGTEGGTVTCSDTACTYDPAEDFRGTDTFTYTVSDGHGGTAVGTVTVTVTNQGPDAVNDNGGAVTAGGEKEIAVLGNDTDPEGDSLSITGKTNGTKGTVACTSTSCTYTAGAGATGGDSFTYTISDGHGGSDTATVSLTVEAAAPGRVSIDAVEPVVVWPSMAQLTGVLETSNGTPVSGQSVELWFKAGPKWKKVGATTSGQAGQLSMQHKPAKKTNYQWRVPGTSVESDNVTVKVAPVVTTGSVVSDLPQNAKLVVKGQATPVVAGQDVELEVQKGSTWETVAFGEFATGSTAQSGGAKFTLREKLTKAGTFTFRVTVPAHKGREAASSEPFTVSVYKVKMVSFSAKGTESLVIENDGNVPIDTTGWKLKSKTKNVALPSRTIEPGARLEIYTGSGSDTDTSVFLGAGDMFGNKKDTVLLKDGKFTALKHKY